jgi:hypothetical protein
MAISMLSKFLYESNLFLTPYGSYNVVNHQGSASEERSFTVTVKALGGEVSIRAAPLAPLVSMATHEDATPSTGSRYNHIVETRTMNVRNQGLVWYTKFVLLNA